ncbi:SpoIIE family protein phosphatase [Caldanaerobius polysaccharolyticus]|uniref:SpoIIE family protein phosphatase n=1 Tax=Caldanaerobius polysaccharolyticus TaxID=44256 RepID=UPI000690704E|nr:SpoIIE family protein phosphatase [Caldanaerobius polysaccharolyticus]
MERIELLPYQRVYTHKIHKIREKKKLNLQIDAGTAMVIMLGFLISRSLFFDQTLPFGLAFYAAALKKEKKYLMLIVPIILSITLVMGAFNALYYAFAVMAFTVIYPWIKDRDITVYAVIASVLQFVSLGFGLVTRFILYDLIVFVLSAAACFSMTFVFYQCIPAVTGMNRRVLSREEAIACAITAGIVLSGFSGIKIGDFSVTAILAALSAMTVGFAGGAGAGCSTGLVVGFISNLTRLNPMLMAVYGLEGLFSGLFNKLGKTGSMIGFAFSYILLYIYIPAIGAYVTPLEMAASLLMFVLLPRSFVCTLREYLDKAVNKHKALADYSLRAKKMSLERIKEISTLMDEISVSMQEFAGDNGVEAMVQQFKGISRILNNLAGDMEAEVEFLDDLEESIRVELDKLGFDVKDVYAIRKGERLEVKILKKVCYGDKECFKHIIPIVSRCVGRKMVQVCGKCDIDRDLRTCCLKLEEADRYNVVTAVVSTSKESVNGDNFSFSQLPYGQYMIALSDGMGTGEKAARESKLALRLIERFIKAGFAEETAVKCVNSLMALRNMDCFTTLDICLFDKYTGDAEFIKMGSSSTFIKKGEKVEVIHSCELPVGILSDVSVSVKNSALKEGDILVMVTDGVLDANDLIKREQWLKQLLMEIDGTPQEIAQKISDETLKITGGRVKDDMTVMVSKIVAV